MTLLHLGPRPRLWYLGMSFLLVGFAGVIVNPPRVILGGMIGVAAIGAYLLNIWSQAKARELETQRE